MREAAWKICKRFRENTKVSWLSYNFLKNVKVLTIFAKEKKFVKRKKTFCISPKWNPILRKKHRTFLEGKNVHETLQFGAISYVRTSYNYHKLSRDFRPVCKDLHIIKIIVKILQKLLKVQEKRDFSTINYPKLKHTCTVCIIDGSTRNISALFYYNWLFKYIIFPLTPVYTIK